MKKKEAIDLVAEVIQTCEGCNYWIDATAECAKQLSCLANGWPIPVSMEKALDADKGKKNTCDEYAG